MNNIVNSFIVRVYGILINDGKILLSDESHRGRHFTKFPGGGLHFGEGTLHCIKREFLEEFNWEIEIKEHFYTTDFFVTSVFDNSQQVISIYYIIESHDKENLKFATLRSIDGDITFWWQPLSAFTPDDVNLPIDKRAAELVIERFKAPYLV